MADHLFGAIELALVFGGVLAWGVWEIAATRRARRDSDRKEQAERLGRGTSEAPRE